MIGHDETVAFTSTGGCASREKFGCEDADGRADALTSECTDLRINGHAKRRTSGETDLRINGRTDKRTRG